MAISTKKVLHDKKTEKGLAEILTKLGGEPSPEDCTCDLIDKIAEQVGNGSSGSGGSSIKQFDVDMEDSTYSDVGTNEGLLKFSLEQSERFYNWLLEHYETIISLKIGMNIPEINAIAYAIERLNFTHYAVTNDSGSMGHFDANISSTIRITVSYLSTETKPYSFEVRGPRENFSDLKAISIYAIK